MEVTVNGKTLEVNNGETLSDVISKKKLDESKVLASVNKEIIKAGTFSEVILKDNDEIEMFCFVSGG